jgi:predicted RecB family nuclease
MAKRVGLGGSFELRASDALDVQVASGTLAKPHVWDALLEILRERGHRHEQAFVEHLCHEGFSPVIIDGVDITPQAVQATTDAMHACEDIIIQAALQHGRWTGRADILGRVANPSALGEWSYEVIDTKLARETKGGTVLQLCLYADLLREVQGVAPDQMYVVAPWSNFEPQVFRFADYGAFYRRAEWHRRAHLFEQ